MCNNTSRKTRYGISMCWGMLFFGIVFFWQSMSHVAFAGNFSISPRVIDLTVSPRDIKDEKIHISNTSGGILTLFAAVHNVTVGLEGGIEEFISPSMSDRTTSLASWIEIKRASFDVPTGGIFEVPFVIRVDPHAKPGTYHAIISYSTGRTIDEAEAFARSSEVPSVLLTVRIAEPSNDFMKLSHFLVKKFILESHMPDTVSYDILNAGDTELKPYGDILLYNGRGEEMGSIPVNQDSRSVQPGETMSFKAQIPEGNLFGKYKALLTVRYGSGQAALYDTVYFYVFPWKKVAFFFGGFLVSALGLSLWFHHRSMSRYRDEDGDGFDDVSHLPVMVKKEVSTSHERDVVMKKP